MTRAQSLLVVVGDPHLLANGDASWRAFIAFAMARGCYVGCDPPRALEAEAAVQ